jgi:hypothetical protein
LSPSRSNPVPEILFRTAVAAIATAVAGPFVGMLAGCAGNLVLSEPLADLVGDYVEKFGDKAGEKLLELGGDYFAERFGATSSDLEAIYRETFLRSLKQLRPRVSSEFDDWFRNWKACVAKTAPGELSAIRSDQLVPAQRDDFLRVTMERLAAEGAAKRHNETTLRLLHYQTIPGPLLDELQRSFPALLEENFRDVISEPDYEEGWKQLQWLSYRDTHRKLDDISRKTDALPDEIIRRMAQFFEQQKLLQGIPGQPAQKEEDKPWALEHFLKAPLITANPVEPRLRAGDWVIARFDPAPSGKWRDPRGTLEAWWDVNNKQAIGFAQKPLRGILRNRRETSLAQTALCIPSYKVDVEWREETLVTGPLWRRVKQTVVKRFLKEHCIGKQMICLILHIGLTKAKVEATCKLFSEDYDSFLISEWAYYKGLEAALSTNDLYKRTWSESALRTIIKTRLMQNDFVRKAMPDRYRKQIEGRPILEADVELVLRGLIENYRVVTAARTAKPDSTVPASTP